MYDGPRLGCASCTDLTSVGAGPMQAHGLFDIPDKRGKFGLVHNIGLGGAVVCSLLRRPEFYKEGGEDGRKRCGRSFSIAADIRRCD